MKTFTLIGKTYLLLLLVGIALIYCVHCIPFSAIKQNVDISCKIIGHEKFYNVLYYDFGFKPNIHQGNMNYLLDGLTDAVMLMETCNTKEENHLRASMANDRIKTKQGELPFDVIDGYTARLNDKNAELYSYGRYWHGYLVTLIPALTMMDLSQIRIFNCILFLLLIISICYLTYRNFSLSAMIAFLIPLAFGLFFPIVPYSLQYSSVFYIAFISSIILLSYNKYWITKPRIVVFFFIVGAITSFFDFLTAPIVTLGFPLLFYGLRKETPTIKELFLLCAIWAMGYSLMWISKWIIAYLLAGVNVFEDAYSHAATWTGTNVERPSLVQLLRHLVVNAPVFNNILLGIILIVLFFIPKKLSEIRKNSWFLFVALVPIAWLILMRRHTYIHYWFSWRNLLVSFFALLLFVNRIADYRRIKQFISTLFKKAT